MCDNRGVLAQIPSPKVAVSSKGVKAGISVKAKPRVLASVVRSVALQFLRSLPEVTSVPQTTLRLWPTRHDSPHLRLGDLMPEILEREIRANSPTGHRGFFGILGDIIALPVRAIGSNL